MKRLLATCIDCLSSKPSYTNNLKLIYAAIDHQQCKRENNSRTQHSLRFILFSTDVVPLFLAQNLIIVFCNCAYNKLQSVTPWKLASNSDY